MELPLECDPAIAAIGHLTIADRAAFWPQFWPQL
jgi:hypothetical protein